MTTIEPLDDSAYHPLRIAEVRRETADAVSLILDVPEALDGAFAYRAGQYVTVRTEIGGRMLARCYSMSSAPETDGALRITVKAVADGRVSGWITGTVKAGDPIAVMPPAGRFCLRGYDGPIVLVGGGSGITPLLSLAKSALATTRRSVTLVYVNRDRGSVIFDAELAALAETNPDHFRLVHWLDSERGLIDAAALGRLDVLDAGADVYICGPDALMDMAEVAARDAGVGEEHLFLERFVSPPDEEPLHGGGGGEGGQTLTIHWRGKTVEAVFEPGYSILGIARDAGLRPPFSCLAGACATCIARVKEGTAVMEANSVLTPAEVEQGYILTCQAVPTSPHIVVEYEG